MSTINEKQDDSPPVIEVSSPTFKVLGRHFGNRKEAEDYVAKVDKAKRVKEENIKKIKEKNQAVVCIEKENGSVDLVCEEVSWGLLTSLVGVWSDEEVNSWERPITIIADSTYIDKVFKSMSDGRGIDTDAIKRAINGTMTVMERCGNTEYRKFLMLLTELDIYPVYVDRD